MDRKLSVARAVLWLVYLALIVFGVLAVLNITVSGIALRAVGLMVIVVAGEAILRMWRGPAEMITEAERVAIMEAIESHQTLLTRIRSSVKGGGEDDETKG